MNKFSIQDLSIQRFFLAILLAIPLFFTAHSEFAQAQTPVWIQVESKNNIRETKQRAQFFARSFPDVSAYQTATGWYAIVIGPMDADEASRQLKSLKSGNQIPGDSFVADGSLFQTRLWPISANADVGTGVVIEEASTDAGEDTQEAVMIEEPVGQAEVEEAIEEIVEAVVEEVEPGPIKDPDLKATRKVERSWTRDQKKQYQTYMVWTGDYQSKIDGAYGPGTRRAIKGFQVREGFEDTGFLTEPQLALLKLRYDDMIAILGLQELRDLDAGVQLDYPSNLVEFEGFEPPFVKYKSKTNSDVRMLLISQEGGRAMLGSLYDIMETFDFIPPDGYRLRKRDWFVLSGRNDDVVSYTYVRTDRKTVKGFTIVWPPERDAEMQQLATAMYNSFTPIKEYVLDETIGYGEDEDQPTDLTVGLETRQPDSSATGFFVNRNGVVLTHADNIASCKRITIAGGTVELKVLAQDAASPLVALGPSPAFSPQTYALFSDEPLEVGAEISIAGFSFPEVMEIAVLNYGTLMASNGLSGNADELRVSAFLEAGDTGGPVLDDRGAIIGLQLPKPPAGEDELPEYVNFALKSNVLTQLLDQNNLAYENSTAFDSLHAVDLAFMAGDFTVKVSCWK